jgi:tetratricopeptide (TPR) repeat protein
VHGRAARAIRARAADRVEAVAGLLSTHYFRAREHEPSWVCSVLAGDEARAKYANVEAVEFYRRALESARHVETAERTELAAVAEALGDVCDLSTLYDESLRAYAFARKQRPDDALTCAQLFRKEGRVLEREGRYTQALRSYTRGVHHVDDRPETPAVAVRASLFAAYGSARYRQGRVREALSWARRSGAEAEQADDRRALAHALRLMELCLEDLGDPERLVYRGRSLPLYEELDDQVGLADELNNLGVCALGEGRLGEALALFDRAREARRRAGDVVGEAAAMNNAAEALLDQGRADEARALLDPALHLWRSAGHPLGIVIGLASLGRALAFLGESDRAVALLDEAITAAEPLNALFLTREIQVRKVEVLVLGGRDTEALALADELVPLGSGAFEERFVAMLHRLRGWSLLRCGRLTEARAAIEGSLARAEAISVAYEIALALRARAEINRRAGDDGAALDDARADALFAELGTVVEPRLLNQPG